MSAINRKLQQSPLIGNIATLVIGLTIVIVGYALDKGDLNERDIHTKIEEKADLKYVDKQDNLLSKALSELKTDIDTDNTRQDEKVETMRREWRVDQKEILRMIKGWHDSR